MEVEKEGNSSGVGSGENTPTASKLLGFTVRMLRLGAVLTTAAAAVVMGLNRESRRSAAAVVGTTTVYRTLVVEYRHMPAFVYFVVTNSTTSGYNLIVLLLGPYAERATLQTSIHLLDAVVLTLVASGVTAARTVHELAVHGNTQARWFPICGTFTGFCNHSDVAVITAFIGIGFMLALNAITAITVHRRA